MKKETIKILLDKYFQAATTLEEERQLKEYFSRQGEIPPSLLPYAPLFQHFGEAGKALPPLPDLVVLPQHKSAFRRNYRAIAAALLVLTSTLLWIEFQPSAKNNPVAESIDWSKYEVQSPEEAFEVTRSAFIKVAQTMDQSSQSSSLAAKNLETLTRVMNIN